MVYGRSIAVGICMLTIVMLLSALMFYLSLGPCPTGTLACDNGTMCVIQRRMCDNRNDCTDGMDEHPVECGLLYGSKEIADKIVRNAIERQKQQQQQQLTISNVSAESSPAGTAVTATMTMPCDISTYPKSCKCGKRSILYCGRYAKLRRWPRISAEVTNLIIIRNNLTLREHVFANLTRLQKLTLKHNNISRLPLGSFSDLPRLESLEISNNNFSYLPHGLFGGLHALQWLFLPYNQLHYFPMAHLVLVPRLEWLVLSHNRLTLRNEQLPKMRHLYEIYLDFNRIEYIGEQTFAQLDNLHLLDLQHNLITHIDRHAFWNLSNIRDIRLVGNPIKELFGETFLHSSRLEALSLAQTPLHIRRGLLQPLNNVSFLNLTGISYEHIEFGAINEMRNLQYVIFDRFFYCSLTPRVRMCKPSTDGISSFKDLLSKPVLRYSAWIMATLTISGNVMVLWGRFIYRDENMAVTMVIRNLALADMLMGFYLVTIGVQDYRFRNEYFKVAMDWISSWQCTAIGMLAVSSSEVSMLILAFMSLERFLLIADPFRGHRSISVRIICLSLLWIWLTGVGLAVAPALLWHSSPHFYGAYSGTCFPLLIHEAYPLGWQYSAFVFLGINLFLLLMIALLYTALLISIWRTRSATPLSLLDCEFAVRFFFIVLTDVLCWAPIIVMKIWVFFNYNISDDIYAWLVVFILPLNSAVNPLLYTFTTPKYRNQILLHGWKKITSRRRAEACNGNVATTTTGTGTGSSHPDDQCTTKLAVAQTLN